VIGSVNRLAVCLGLALWLGGAGAQATVMYTERPEVRRFIEDLVSEHGLDRQHVQTLLATVERQERVLELIQRPAEAKPWHEYRQIFLTDARIAQGVAFWRQHAELLQRVADTHGVPPRILVAIVGVETFYGRITGGFPVLDTLTTLGFDYPPRAGFFRAELREFLLLTAEEQLDARELEGSYAGAMGMSQFIASSYRHYAVDFDGDGKRDLWTSVDDALASIAVYLVRHGWQQALGIAAPVSVGETNVAPLLERGLQPSLSYTELQRRGLEPQAELAAQPSVALIELEGRDGAEYWLGTANFYAITRYNHSALYAMAVYQLAEAIRARRQAKTAAAR